MHPVTQNTIAILLGKKNCTFAFKYLVVLTLVLSSAISRGQDTAPPKNAFDATDSILNVHSPHKAAIYSALIPGLGQIYNKKYWKLPIIYGATGIFIYIFDFNNDLYNEYKIAHADLVSGRIESYRNITDPEVILRAKESVQRTRDLNVILLAAIYLLNVVDATVDAHLFNYRITDDLSLNFHPSIKQQYGLQETYGLTLQVKF